LEDTQLYKDSPHVQGVIKAVREVLGEADSTYSDFSWLKKV
jgi:hypothetical protein